MYGKYGLMARLFERVTGQPWMTVRSCTEEFGPPPGSEYRRELAGFTDAELLRYDKHVLLAGARRARAAATAREEVGRGWDSVEAMLAWRDDLLLRADRVVDPDEAVDLREQAAMELLRAAVAR